MCFFYVFRNGRHSGTCLSWLNPAYRCACYICGHNDQADGCPQSHEIQFVFGQTYMFTICELTPANPSGQCKNYTIETTDRLGMLTKLASWVLSCFCLTGLMKSILGFPVSESGSMAKTKAVYQKNPLILFQNKQNRENFPNVWVLEHAISFRKTYDSHAL